MQPAISVIICTYNPRPDYLELVLQALKVQTLPTEQWELLLVDNASNEPLSLEIDLSWHPQAHHIREEQLGLTPARLRGIKEAVADTLVFVDDDNVLDQDYLQVALNISKDWPILGAWGGQIIPEFEEPPPDWTKPYLPMLAIREFERDKWSNLLHNYETTPHGAGLCVRKVVAKKYYELIHNEQKRASLDRKGQQLLCCGDTDLALTSWDVNLGTGEFVSLKLTHLIAKNRLQEEYLLRLAEGNGYSTIILESFRGKMPDLPNSSWRSNLFELYKLWWMTPRDRRFYKAFQTGRGLAIQEILKHEL
jgi:glycosyltransferase involved in cell wall biosynthesis